MKCSLILSCIRAKLELLIKITPAVRLILNIVNKSCQIYLEVRNTLVKLIAVPKRSDITLELGIVYDSSESYFRYFLTKSLRKFYFKDGSVFVVRL